VYRAWRLDPGFEVADPEDVEDLLAMLAIVPFDELIHDSVMLLNPDFGDSAAPVGGADADLIVDDMLVDIKVTKLSTVRERALPQLLGFYLPARPRGGVAPQSPALTGVALSFARHGHLWVHPVSDWTKLPVFPEVERWFWR